MPLAKEVASELRKLADSLDASPEATIPKAYMSFCPGYDAAEKQRFLNIVRLMPDGAKPKHTDSEMRYEYNTDFLCLNTFIDRAKVSEIVSPAVYRVDPILAELEADNG